MENKFDVHIFPKNFEKFYYNYKVIPSDTVRNIKEKIKNDLNIKIENQILTYNGKHLDNNNTLAYYGIIKTSIIYLFYLSTEEFNKPMKIDIRKPNGKIITLNVKISDTIGNIKEKLEKMEGAPIGELIYKNRLLNDSFLLDYYNFKNNSLLDLLKVGSSLIYYLMDYYVLTLNETAFILELRQADIISYIKQKIFECIKI